MANQVKWRTVGIALGATVTVALGGAWAANAVGVFERPAPEPASVVQEQPTSTPIVTMTPTPAPTPEPVAPPVEEAPVETGPTLCADGWFASSVDENGNESGCTEGNDEGQPCVSYGENNECTAYYKP